MDGRGSWGYCLSSSQNSSIFSWRLGFYGGNSSMDNLSKAYGSPLRCLRD